MGTNLEKSYKLLNLLVLFLLTIAYPLHGEEKFITAPPKGWNCIDDSSQLPQKVKVIYIGQAMPNNTFTPSINVACEETALTIGNYVKAAKIYHEGQRDTRCTLLGKLQTEAGPVELLQIDRSSHWGAIRFIQAILIKEGEAYVVTATCLKENFSSLSSQIFKAIHSLTIPEKILRTN